MKFWSIVIFIILFIITTLLMFLQMQKDTIKIGLLYSKTGTMSVEEKVFSQALHYKVDEINQQGGLLNRKVEIVEFDGASTEEKFAEGAAFLINQNIDTIFGCWTSASRKAVKPIIEDNNALLFYPVQYEGVESSQNIIYLGSTINQQINPILSYIKKHYGNKIFVVGSNYIYPRMAGEYINRFSETIGLNLLGQHYFPLGHSDFSAITAKLKQLKPDAIINLVNGNSNADLFHTLSVSNSKLPVFSTSIDERTLASIQQQYPTMKLDNHFSSAGYFHQIHTKRNQALKNRMQQRFGADFLLTDAGYNMLLAFDLWKRAVIDTHSTDIKRLKNSIQGDSLQAAGGIAFVNQNNNHLHKPMRLAKVTSSGFQTVWNSEVLTNPHPFPHLKNDRYWIDKLTNLYSKWGNKWRSDKVIYLEGAKDE